MTSPTTVNCPQCKASLDLSAVKELPPQVRCGQCGKVFTPAEGAAAAGEEATRPRWKGEEAEQSSDREFPEPALPPSIDQAAGNEAISESELQGYDPTPSHLRSRETGSGPAETSGAAAAPLPPAIPDQPPAREIPSGQQEFHPGSHSADQAAASTPLVGLGHGEEPRYRRHARGGGLGIILLLGAGTGTLVLAAFILGGLNLLGFSVTAWDSDDEDRVEEIVNETQPRQVRWTDADRFSAKLAGVTVKVERVEYGEVRARNEQAELQTSQDDSFLQIFFKLSNDRIQEVEYTSWYGNRFREGEERRIAKLWDDDQVTYPMLVFRDALNIHGHTPQASLERSVDVRDTIVFEIPADVKIDELDYFRLELPAAAFGERGHFRFEIPSSMIRSAQSGGNLLGAEEASGSEDDEGG